jgi:MFS family permease
MAEFAAPPLERSRRRATTLLEEVAFRRLWAGQTVSVFGSQVTSVALPLAAVVVLHASSLQVGLLTTASYSAFLGIGLPAGVWVDRLRRRPVMMTADLVRAAAVASVPVAAALGDLTLIQLYLAALTMSAGTVFFDVAYLAYLPGLVGRERMMEANAKLQMSQSLAQVTGPGFGGFLVGVLTAPVALLADAASFIVSVGALAAVHWQEPAPAVTESRSLPREIGEGLRFVFGHTILRMIAGATSSANLFISAYLAIIVVFLVRQMGLSPGLIGVLTSAGAAGGMLGAFGATQLARRLGSARIIWLSLSVTAPFALLIPLTFRGPGLILYAVGTFVLFMGGVIYNINQASFRQVVCPDNLQGRVNATMRFLVWGTLPLGGLAGGTLGGWLGSRDGLWVAAVGITLAPVWLLLSPLRGMQDFLPATETEQYRPAEPTAGTMPASRPTLGQGDHHGRHRTVAH